MHVFCAYEGLEMGISGTETDRIRTIDLDPAAPSPSRKTKVLIVSNDASLRILAGSTLTCDGCVVSEASHGQEAIDEYVAEQPDLVVLDGDMPGLTGIDTLKRLRASDPDTPVLILTPNGDERLTRAGFDAGAIDYLAKPFTPPQLTSRARACLGRASIAAASAK
jgi:DNA-binding response OmpR family regulator